MTGSAAHCEYCIDDNADLRQRVADYLDDIEHEPGCMGGDCEANAIVKELRAILAGAS